MIGAGFVGGNAVQGMNSGRQWPGQNRQQQGGGNQWETAAQDGGKGFPQSAGQGHGQNARALASGKLPVTVVLPSTGGGGGGGGAGAKPLERVIERLQGEAGMLATQLDQAHREKENQRVEISQLRKQLMRLGGRGLMGGSFGNNIIHNPNHSNAYSDGVNYGFSGLEPPYTDQAQGSLVIGHHEVLTDHSLTNADRRGHPSEQELQDMQLYPTPALQPSAVQPIDVSRRNNSAGSSRPTKVLSNNTLLPAAASSSKRSPVGDKSGGVGADKNAKPAAASLALTAKGKAAGSTRPPPAATASVKKKGDAAGKSGDVIEFPSINHQSSSSSGMGSEDDGSVRSGGSKRSLGSSVGGDSRRGESGSLRMHQKSGSGLDETETGTGGGAAETSGTGAGDENDGEGKGRRPATQT